jgi:outer membrane lipoprotein-sorting protein
VTKAFGGFDKMKKNILMLVAITMLVGAVHAFAKKTEPGDILKKTAAAYKALQSYSDTMTVTVNVNAKGMQQKMEVESDFTLQRPDKVAVTGKSGLGAVTFISNGEKLWIYVPMLKKYSVSDAPSGFEELLKNPLLGSQMGGPAGFINSMALAYITLYSNRKWRTLRCG